MSNRKMQTAEREANRGRVYSLGLEAKKEILKCIPQELTDRLTGRELGMVMAAIDRSYHNGVKSVGIQTMDDCVFVPRGLVPFDIIKKIKVSKVAKVGRVGKAYRYTLDETE